VKQDHYMAWWKIKTIAGPKRAGSFPNVVKKSVSVLAPSILGTETLKHRTERAPKTC